MPLNSQLVQPNFTYLESDTMHLADGGVQWQKDKHRRYDPPNIKAYQVCAFYATTATSGRVEIRIRFRGTREAGWKTRRLGALSPHWEDLDLLLPSSAVESDV